MPRSVESGATCASVTSAGARTMGRAGESEQRLGFGSESRERGRDFEIRGHHGEGFLLAKFALAQRGDGSGIAGIAGEVITANALDGEDTPQAQQIGRARNRGRIGIAIEQVARTAGGTGDGLGVEAAVGRVGVLRFAQRVHGPMAHGGAGAIVRQTFDDGITRAAVGAVDIWIAIARVGGIAHFGETVGADGEVGRNTGQRRAGAACFADGEIAKAGGLAKAHVDGGDARGGRRLGGQVVEKSGDGRLGAFEANVDSILLVEHPTGE